MQVALCAQVASMSRLALPSHYSSRESSSQSPSLHVYDQSSARVLTSAWYTMAAYVCVDMTIADMLWHQCCISLLRVFVRTYKRDRRHISEVCHTIGLAVWVIAVNGSAVLTRLRRRSDTLRCHGGDPRCASGLRERQGCSESFRRSHRQCSAVEFAPGTLDR